MPNLIDTVQLQEIDAGYVELFDFTLPSGTDVHLFKGLEAPSPIPFGDLNGVPSAYFSTPDIVTTWAGLDVRARATNHSIPYFYNFLLSKYPTFFMALYSDKITLRVYDSVGVTQRNYSSITLPSPIFGVRNWYRATFDTVTGDVKFYLADGSLESPSISDYTQLGPTQNTGAFSINLVGSDIFTAGSLSRNASYPFDGDIYRSQVFNTVGGTTPIVDFTPRSYKLGSTLVSSTSGETWTLEGDAAISPPPPTRVPFGDLDGVGADYFSTPNVVTTWGELDIRARAQIDSISTYAFLADKDYSFFLAMRPAGHLVARIVQSPVITDISSVVIPSVFGVINWYRATYDAATGDVKFFTADGNLEAPAISDYVQLGATQNIGVRSIPVSTSLFLAGAWGANTSVYPFDGDIYRSQVFNEIDGTTPIVDFDFSDYVSSPEVKGSVSQWIYNNAASHTLTDPSTIDINNTSGGSDFTGNTYATGVEYTVTYTVSGYVSGSVGLSFGSGAINIARTGNGTYTETGINSGSTLIYVRSNTGTQCTIVINSIKEAAAPTTWTGRGPELIDNISASAWNAQGTNTVTDPDAETVVVTYVDDVTGAFYELDNAGGLSQDLILGRAYVVTGLAKVNNGAVSLRIYPGDGSADTANAVAISATSYVPFQLNFTVVGAAINAKMQAYNMGGTEVLSLQSISIKETQVFSLNGTARVRGLEAAYTPSPGSVYFPNKAGTLLKEYLAVPLEIKGIELSSSGAAARPILSIANIPALSRSLDANETTLIDEGIYKNEDLLGTVVEYRTTLSNNLKTYLDAAASPVEFPSHRFIVDRVSSENRILVEFELASVFDIEGVTLPFRQINGRYCPWEYQGRFLGNRGGCNWNLNSNGRFYDKDDAAITVPSDWSSTATYSLGDNVKTISNGHTQIWKALIAVPVNKSPLLHKIYWKRLDVCGKLISSCKVRFQGNAVDSTLSQAVPLPFGGFPGTRTFK